MNGLLFRLICIPFLTYIFFSCEREEVSHSPHQDIQLEYVRTKMMLECCCRDYNRIKYSGNFIARLALQKRIFQLLQYQQKLNDKYRYIYKENIENPSSYEAALNCFSERDDL